MTCAGFYDVNTFYVVRIHRMIYKFLQNTVEKLNNDGILEYNPKVYCGNITVLYCGKMKIIMYKPRIDTLWW